MLAAGWTNVAFLLAVIDGEVVRVLILFYLSPLWAALLGRWLLGEALGIHTALMLLLGLSGAVVMLWQPGALDRGLGQADGLGLSAGFAFALANVMTRRLQALGDVIKTQLSWIGVVSVSLLWLLFRGEAWPSVPLAGWLGALALGGVRFHVHDARGGVRSEPDAGPAIFGDHVVRDRGGRVERLAARRRGDGLAGMAGRRNDHRRRIDCGTGEGK